MSRKWVKAGKDLRFRVQGQIVSETEKVFVKLTHDVEQKIRNGSLIFVDKDKKKVVKNGNNI